MRIHSLVDRYEYRQVSQNIKYTAVMNLVVGITLYVLTVHADKPRPKEITDDYIKKFAKEIEEFKKPSHATLFKDETFNPEKYDEHAAFSNADTYDFIVVGAGAAGSVIASRLSEIPEWKVLLLEAGDTEPSYAEVPRLSGFLQTTKYNWGYVTKPQETWCLGMVGQACAIPSGKALGGGTAINDMAYTRGNARDYNLWDDQGNPGWCYNEVLPYFKKAEDSALKEFDRKYHHQGGRLNFVLNVTKFDEGSPFDQVKTWLEKGIGPLAIVAASALAYVKTNASKDQADYPDVELLLDEAVFVDFVRIKEEYKSVQEPESHYQPFRIAVMPTHPKSVGTIKLKSKNPFHGPVIDLNQLNDPEGRDIETMLAGIKEAIEIINTVAFQKLGARLHTEPVKDCIHFEFGSDDYWKCAVKYLSISLRHQTGACKMGPSNDKSAVVDSKFRVHGIHKLRVADSSIIPVDITGHTHAAANMIGEKAADLIKEHWA